MTDAKYTLASMEAARRLERRMTLDEVIRLATRVADRDKYTPQESAAAWDVVDALTQLRTAGERVTADPDQDDRDGKTIARAAEIDEGDADV